MKTIKLPDNHGDIDHLIEEASSSGEPIYVKGTREKAVIIGEKEWRAIQETLYLLSIPGMRDSIREGMETPLDECSDRLAW